MERPNHDKRRELSTRYRVAMQGVSQILFRADPIGVAAFGPPPDEYDQEAQLILARADEATTPTELAEIVREVFADQFGGVELGVNYTEVAQELWPTIQELVDGPSV